MQVEGKVKDTEHRTLNLSAGLTATGSQAGKELRRKKCSMNYQ